MITEAKTKNYLIVFEKYFTKLLLIDSNITFLLSQ